MAIEGANADVIGMSVEDVRLATLACLANRKHVVCEKPMGLNLFEMNQMIAASKKYNQFLLEGVWTRFFPAFKRARDMVDKKEIGNMIAYQGNLGFPSGNHWKSGRTSTAMMDMGIYTTHSLPILFGNRMPTRITANGSVLKKEEGSIDFLTMASIIYEDRDSNEFPVKFAQIQVNKYIQTSNEHDWIGTHGRLRLDRWCPTRLTVTVNDKEKVFEYPLPDIDTNGMGFNYINSNGFFYEIDSVISHIDDGLIESPLYTHSEMALVSRITDSILTQIRGSPYQSKL